MSLWHYKGTQLVPLPDVYEMMIKPVQWEANYLQKSSEMYLGKHKKRN